MNCKVCVPSRTSAGQLWYYTNSLNDTDVLLCFLSQPISNADFIVPVEIDGTVHQVLYTHNKSIFLVKYTFFIRVKSSIYVKILKRTAVIQFK